MLPRIAIPPTLTTAPFTNREAKDAGLTKGRLRGADLNAPFRGVRTLGPPRSVEELARAFQHRAAASTFFCSVTAAQLMGIPLPRRVERQNELHVGVTSPTRSPRAVGVVGHKYLIDSRDLRVWRGLRITTPERTWCDLASVVTIPELVAAGDYLIHWRSPITTPDLIEKTLLGHRGRRGRKRSFLALQLLSDRSESPQESILRVNAVHGGVQGLEVNFPVRTTTGFNYRGDLAVPRRKLIIEYQSRYHEQPEDFRRDMTRISRLEADGWYVMQVNLYDLDNPVELLRRIRTVLHTRPIQS